MSGWTIDIERRGALWILVGVAALVVLCLVQVARLSVGVDRGADVVLCGSTAGACLLYRPQPGSWQEKLFDSLESMALFALICGLGTVASYAVAAMTHGYADALLSRADRAIGFDWMALYRFTERHTLFSLATRTGYMSIFLTPTLLLVALCCAGRTAAARRFLAGYALALIVALAIFAIVPARAASLHYLGADPSYIPATGLSHGEVIEGLRAGTLTRIGIGSLVGLITFPSFHAASAILFIWGSWPLPRLRVAMTAINLLMLAATPIEGSHYLIDVLGGAAVALAAILAAEAAARAGRRALPPRSARVLRPA